MTKVYYLVCVALLLFGCKTKNFIASNNTHDDGNYTPIQNADTFEVTILDYVLGCECGVLSCASNFVAVRGNADTVRILTYCSNDTTIEKGIRYKVIPSPVPTATPKIATRWIATGTGKDVVMDKLFTKKMPTYYGTLRSAFTTRQ